MLIILFLIVGPIISSSFSLMLFMAIFGGPIAWLVFENTIETLQNGQIPQRFNWSKLTPQSEPKYIHLRVVNDLLAFYIWFPFIGLWLPYGTSNSPVIEGPWIPTIGLLVILILCQITLPLYIRRQAPITRTQVSKLETT